MIGFVAGGLLTQNGMANYCFLIMVVSTFFVDIAACFLDSRLENDQKDLVEQNIFTRVRTIYSQIKECVRERTLSRMFLFVILAGAVTPRFDDYMYQYYTSPSQANFSQLEYGMIRLASLVGVFLGLVVFNLFLKQMSTKKVVFIAFILFVISAIGHVIFLMKITLGMPPLVYSILLESISDTFQLAFMAMPLMATVTKLIPHSVEATVFAFFTGIVVLNQFVVSKITGNLINLYFKVDKDSLENLWKLFVVQTLSIFIAMCFVCLLPDTAQVEQVQAQIKEAREQQEASKGK